MDGIHKISGQKWVGAMAPQGIRPFGSHEHDILSAATLRKADPALKLRREKRTQCHIFN